MVNSMIALFVNNIPALVGSDSEIESRIKEIRKDDPDADIHKQDTCKCGSCGTEYFDDLEAITCPCHDSY